MVKIGVYAVAAVLSLSGGSQRWVPALPLRLCAICCLLRAPLRAGPTRPCKPAQLGYVTHPIAPATGCVWTSASAQLCSRQRAWCSLQAVSKEIGTTLSSVGRGLRAVRGAEDTEWVGRGDGKEQNGARRALLACRGNKSSGGRGRSRGCGAKGVCAAARFSFPASIFVPQLSPLFLPCRGRLKDEKCSGAMAPSPLDCICRPVYGGRGERLTRGGHDAEAP